jgi:hypothetical protein
MKHFLVGIGIALCLINTAFATSKWPLPMDIKQVGNAPAACLPKSEDESIELKMAYVNQSFMTRGAGLKWIIELNPGATPLVMHPGDCLVYGTLLDGYTQTLAAKPLEVGRPHVFSLERNDEGKKWTSRFHSATFCGLTMPDGRIVFRKFIRKDGSTPPDICAYVESQLLNDPSSNITQ